MPDDYGPVIAADAPSAWYRCEDTPTANGVVTDTQGNANGVFPAATAITSVASIVPSNSTGHSFNHPGTAANNSFWTATSAAVFTGKNGTPWSLECWCTRNAASLTAFPFAWLVGNRTNGFSAMRSNANANLSCETFGGSGTGPSFGKDVPADGNGHHVVYAYDGTTVRCYVDGVVAGTTFAPATFPTPTVFTLTVGQDTSANNNPWRGVIDEVAYYQTALSQAQVTAHYNAGLGPPWVPQDNASELLWTVRSPLRP